MDSPARPYAPHAAQHRTCPRCGQLVYKARWERHERDCVSVVTRFGSPRELARMWRAEPELQVSDLTRQLPGVSNYVMKSMLVAGGISRNEIAERTADDQPDPYGRQKCRRCRILLDARGVRPGADDPGLCWWCDGTAPALRVEPEDALPEYPATADGPHAHIRTQGRE